LNQTAYAAEKSEIISTENGDDLHRRKYVARDSHQLFGKRYIHCLTFFVHLPERYYLGRDASLGYCLFAAVIY
jgi:hypothetical protein